MVVEATEPDHRGLRLSRPFGWGVVIVMDRDSADVPERLNESGVASSPTALAFRVRHAQDVELEGLDPDDELAPFAVSVDVAIGSPVEPFSFAHEILIPSGVVTIGDADHEDELSVSPGRWRVTVNLEPEDHAENVKVWLTGAAEN